MFITHCRHRILYPLQLEPSFPNDAEILKPKVGLGPNVDKDLHMQALYMCTQAQVYVYS